MTQHSLSLASCWGPNQNNSTHRDAEGTVHIPSQLQAPLLILGPATEGLGPLLLNRPIPTLPTGHFGAYILYCITSIHF